MAPTPEAVSLRIKLRYGDLNEFVDRYHENISSAGLFLRTRAPKPTGTQIRFELSLENGMRVLRGEGVVVQTRTDDKPGMALRFNLLDADSQAIVERVVTTHGQGGLAPTPLSNAFPGGAAQRHVTPHIRAPWRTQPGGRTGWSRAHGPIPVDSSIHSSTTASLPRRPTRAFSEPPPASMPEGRPPSGGHRTLPRLRSSMLRPWSRGPKTTEAPPPPPPRKTTVPPVFEEEDRTIAERWPVPHRPAKPKESRADPGEDREVCVEEPKPPTSGRSPAPNRPEIPEHPGATTPPQAPDRQPTSVHVETAALQAPAVPPPTASYSEGLSPPRAAPHPETAGLQETPARKETAEPPPASGRPAPPSPQPDARQEASKHPPVLHREVVARPEAAARQEPPDRRQGANPEATADRPQGAMPPDNPSHRAALELRLEPEGHETAATLVLPTSSPEAKPTEEIPEAAPTPPPFPLADQTPATVGYPSQETADIGLEAWPPSEVTEDTAPPAFRRTEGPWSTTDEVDRIEEERTNPSDRPVALALDASEDAKNAPRNDLYALAPDEDPSLRVPPGLLNVDPDVADTLAIMPAKEPPPEGGSARDSDPATIKLPGREASPFAFPDDVGTPLDDAQTAVIPDVKRHFHTLGLETPFGAQTSGSESPNLPHSGDSESIEDDPAAYADTADIAGRTITKVDDETGLADTLDVPRRRHIEPNLPKTHDIEPPEDTSVDPTPKTTTADVPSETQKASAGAPLDGATLVMDAYRGSAPGRRASSTRPSHSASITVTGLSSEEAEHFAQNQANRPAGAHNRPLVEPSATLDESGRPSSRPPDTGRRPSSTVPPPTSPAAPTSSKSSAREHRVVGIDLGGRWARVGLIEQGELKLIAAEDSPFIPALVALRADGSIVAGKQALRIARAYPNRATSIRDVLGGPDRNSAGRPGRGPPPEQEAAFVGLGLPAAELVDPFFQLVKRSITRHLNASAFRAVLGIPRAWSPQAVRNTVRACGEAGIEVARTLTEPDALVEAYNFRERDVEHILMVDFGATHVAAMVARKKQDSFELLDWHWTAEVSAATLDDAIVELAMAQLDKNVPANVRHHLKEASEFARLDIHRTPQVELKFSVPASGERSGVTEHTVALSRGEIYRATEGPVIDVCRRVREVIEKAGVEPRALDAVVTIGSGGQYPPFTQTLTALAQREPLVQYPPAQTCIAGLARHALAIEREDSTQADDALRASIGIELPGGRFGPLVRAGSTIPLRLERQFPTTRDNQAELELRFFQGDAEFVRSCQPLGRLVLTGFPRGLRGETRIRLSLTINAEGVLKVRLFEPKSGTAEEFTAPTRQTPEDTADLIRQQLRHRSHGARDKKKPGLLNRLFGRK